LLSLLIQNELWLERHGGACCFKLLASNLDVTVAVHLRSGRVSVSLNLGPTRPATYHASGTTPSRMHSGLAAEALRIPLLSHRIGLARIVFTTLQSAIFGTRMRVALESKGCPILSLLLYPWLGLFVCNCCYSHAAGSSASSAKHKPQSKIKRRWHWSNLRFRCRVQTEDAKS
jgi:hypothetical protein